ncbi:hypothetical protein AJ88_30990 [Mesorhizobium amorphae CCBAU 01583]|nr:hypothetical protein AJ88_30990 [Mesorhizobium amorphae CCBAU 01583]
MTFDWMGKSDFRGSTNGFCGPAPQVACTSTDTSSYSAMLLLANAYVDIGTWHGVTPYVAPASAAPGSSGTRCTTATPMVNSNTQAVRAGALPTPSWPALPTA